MVFVCNCNDSYALHVLKLTNKLCRSIAVTEIVHALRLKLSCVKASRQFFYLTCTLPFICATLSPYPHACVCVTSVMLCSWCLTLRTTCAPFQLCVWNPVVEFILFEASYAHLFFGSFARNFTLYRLESTYEIRDDLAKAIIKIRPRLSYNP